MRTEHDSLGERQVPAGALHGIHTLRALENFPLSGRPVHPALAAAYGAVKLACLRTNRRLGMWPDAARVDAMETACRDLMEGRLVESICVDALQGGAGTSTNMNVNEVLANRALDLLGHPRGAYEVISPLNDLNLHQSTNDTFPTALRLAAIWRLRELEVRVTSLQEAFQAKEQAFAAVVKVGRTEFQDGVLITLGREMGAYAEAFNRDRWRLYKCEERLRVVNLGGTAVGTGLGAPREYIFRVVDELRELTGIGFARAENLVEATQNTDVLVEVSGMLKACATSLIKIANDLRLLSSGPDAGLGEVRLPALQAGSSMMPGKVNPVIPEAVVQAALRVLGHDSTIAMASALGSLELNAMMPLMADSLLESLDLLTRACALFEERCVRGMEACVEKCRANVAGTVAAATALVPVLGYERAAALAAEAARSKRSLQDLVVEKGLLTAEAFAELISAEAVCRLGHPKPK
ncbi:MAG: aspartate ammonia-lyase [bacterium]